MEKNATFFVAKKLHFSTVLDFIWTWTSH